MAAAGTARAGPPGEAVGAAAGAGQAEGGFLACGNERSRPIG